MIEGVVEGRHALVTLTVRGPGGQEAEVEFVLDTGFVGYLTLSPALVAALQLPFDVSVPAYLADGSRVFLDLYTSTVLWDGLERDVEVLATGGEPLLGTSMLEDHDITIRFVDGGRVTIEPV